MKTAVAHLIPFMEAEKAGNLKVEGVSDDGNSHAGTVIMATVKGDVHGQLLKILLNFNYVSNETKHVLVAISKAQCWTSTRFVIFTS